MKSVEKQPMNIWEEFERIRSEFSESVLKDLPRDLSSNHDHYLYGIAKKNKWQPIETAPKDGTNILVYSESIGRMIAWYKFNNYPFGDWVNLRFDIISPTHWMPLPEPPKED